MVSRPSNRMSETVEAYVDAVESLIMGFAKAMRGVLRKNGLTPVQFLVLQWSATEGSSSMTALATFLGVRPQSVTPVIDSLVDGGWIRRERSKLDRRQTLLELSPDATRLMAAVRRGHIGRLKRSLGKFPASTLSRATEVLQETERALVVSIDLFPAARLRKSRKSPKDKTL